MMYSYLLISIIAGILIGNTIGTQIKNKKTINLCKTEKLNYIIVDGYTVKCSTKKKEE
jgi:hypothetical protein